MVEVARGIRCPACDTPLSQSQGIEGLCPSCLLELAMDVGFNSKSSFNRAFRKFAGTTPSKFLAGL